jgi:hypothetical protein
VANSIDVLGPIDHRIIYSIYFHDLNGIRLEITTPLLAEWNDNIEAAKASLADWETVKGRRKNNFQLFGVALSSRRGTAGSGQITLM